MISFAGSSSLPQPSRNGVFIARGDLAKAPISVTPSLPGFEVYLYVDKNKAESLELSDNLKRAMVMHEMAQGFDSQGLTLRRGCIGKVMLPKKRKALWIQ